MTKATWWPCAGLVLFKAELSDLSPINLNFVDTLHLLYVKNFLI